METKKTFDPLAEERKATALRTLCERHLCDHPGEVLNDEKQLVARADVVRRWASQRALWNVEHGGLTLAEIWFVALCYQDVATHPPTETLEPVDCIALYDQLRAWCRRRTSGIDTALFHRVAYAIVFVLSHGLDETAAQVAEQHFKKEAPASQRTQLVQRQASDSLAGNAILGFVPLASRVFWCAWTDELACLDAEEAKVDASEFNKFQQWMKRQFGMPTQQAFRIALTDLFYKDRVPTGGHTFYLRGSAAVGDKTPAYALVQMELGESEQKALTDAIESTIPEMEAKVDHPAREMALVHMFAYTFANRLQKGDKITLFDPFIVHKWDLPDRLSDLGPTTQWGRPRRPVIVQTQTGWLLHHVQCTCQPVVADHREGPLACVLRRRVVRCPDAMHALFLWLWIVRTQFRDTLACSTSLSKLSSEIFDA